MTPSRCVSLFDLRPDLRPARDGDPVTVQGDLNLYRSSITEVPKHFSVTGDLDLSKSCIRHLPEGLRVDGTLNLEFTSIEGLSENLFVGGDLNLYKTPLTHLPDGLTVGRNLCLTNTPITTLPKRLSVGRHLNLQNTRITHLPTCLSVGGCILPPATLVDLLRLRATLTQAILLGGAQGSAHDTARMHAYLLSYPDVLRVWQSLSHGGLLRVEPMSPFHPSYTGYYVRCPSV